jgi:uncharacterized protein YdbL (DUF1318 family)
MNNTLLASTALLSVCVAGCIQVKTESEIKPIHITMDINLKVDKELDRAFADEDRGRTSGNFKAVQGLLTRQAAGLTVLAMLEARAGATDRDLALIAEENAKRLARYEQIAKESGVALETVQKRRALRVREHLSAGAWYQDNAGAWRQK